MEKNKSGGLDIGLHAKVLANMKDETEESLEFLEQCESDNDSCNINYLKTVRKCNLVDRNISQEVDMFYVGSFATGNSSHMNHSYYHILTQRSQSKANYKISQLRHLEELVLVPNEESGEEDGKTKTVELVPTKSQPVTQAYECNHCNYTTGKGYLMYRHMKLHFEELPRKLTDCKRGVKTLAPLQNPVNTHIELKSYQCKSCPSAFSRRGELLRHERYKHTHEKPFKCSICDNAYVEYNKLKYHMARHTGKKIVIKCDLCPATCSSRFNLRRHVQKLHTSDKPIKCQRCEDVFPDRHQYKVHYESHKGGIH